MKTLSGHAFYCFHHFFHIIISNFITHITFYERNTLFPTSFELNTKTVATRLVSVAFKNDIFYTCFNVRLYPIGKKCDEKFSTPAQIEQKNHFFYGFCYCFSVSECEAYKKFRAFF